MTYIFIRFLLALLALILMQAIYSGILLLVAPLCLAEPSSVNILGLKFIKESGKGWHYVMYKPSIAINSYTRFNQEKIKGKSEAELDFKERTGLYISAAGSLLISVLVTFVLHITLNIPELTYTGICMIAFAAVQSVITISALNRSRNPSVLNYCQGKIKLIRAGIPYPNLDIKPLNELPYGSKANYEKVLHFQLYFHYLESVNDTEKLQELMSEYDEFLSGLSAEHFNTGAIYATLYYYSRYDINIEKAKALYSKIGPVITKDPDANSFRIRGFYTLNILGNKDEALRLADTARSKVDIFSFGSEREHERMLIEDLYQAISSYQ